MRSLVQILIGMMACAAAPVTTMQPASAQGTTGVQIVSMMNGTCPTGYMRAQQRGAEGNIVPGDPQLCYPASDNPPAVYQRISSGGTCLPGYHVDAQTDWCTNRAPQPTAKSAKSKSGSE